MLSEGSDSDSTDESAEEGKHEEPQDTNHNSDTLIVKCLIQPCGGCSELANLEAQTPTAQNFLNIIRTRHAMKLEINLWHDRLVARLPIEIISQIFVFFSRSGGGSIKKYHAHGHFHRSGRMHLSVLLSSICKKWRNIALTTPELWTSFDIRFGKNQTQLAAVTQWLSRSHSLPLSLSIRGGRFGRDTTSLDALIKVLRSQSSRWEYLDGVSASNLVVHKLLHDLEDLPVSDSLYLRLEYLDRLDPITLSQPLRPKVFYSQEGDQTKLPMKWDNLTHLELFHFPINAVLTIIDNAPQLTNCVYVLHIPDYPDLLPTTPIINNSLKNLKLIIPRKDTSIFRHITLPSLEDLQITVCDMFMGSPRLTFADLIHFLDRSKLKAGRLRKFFLMCDLVERQHDGRFVELTSLTHISISFERNSTILQSYLSKLANGFHHLRSLQIRLSGYNDSVQVSAASWALLSDLCQENPSSSGHTRTALMETTSDDNMPGKIGLPENTSISLSGSDSRRCRRPLESLSVTNCSGFDTSNMEHNVRLRFLEVENDGAVKLELRDKNGGNVLRQAKSICDLSVTEDWALHRVDKI